MEAHLHLSACALSSSMESSARKYNLLVFPRDSVQHDSAESRKCTCAEHVRSCKWLPHHKYLFSHKGHSSLPVTFYCTEQGRWSIFLS